MLTKPKTPTKIDEGFLVTLTGFKPVTAGAEIQCAIQLRHRAIFLTEKQKRFKKQLCHPIKIAIFTLRFLKINSYHRNTSKNNHFVHPITHKIKYFCAIAV